MLFIPQVADYKAPNFEAGGHMQQGMYMPKGNITVMMTSWHGNAFHITGPLSGESTGHRWISLHKGPIIWSLWCLRWCFAAQAFYEMWVIFSASLKHFDSDELDLILFFYFFFQRRCGRRTLTLFMCCYERCTGKTSSRPWIDLVHSKFMGLLEAWIWYV